MPGQDRFSEVFELIFDGGQAEKALLATVSRFKSRLDELQKAANLTKKELDFASIIKESNDKLAFATGKALGRDIKAHEMRKDALAKINSDIAKDQELQLQRSNDATVKSVDRQIQDQVSANQRRKEAIAKINADIAKDHARQQQIDIANNARAVQRQIETARRELVERQRVNAQLVSDRISAIHRIEREEARSLARKLRLEQSARTSPGFTIGNALRLGAGVSGTFGNFQGASALYALERAAAMAGVAKISLTGLSGALPAVAAGFAAISAAAIPLISMFAAGDFNRALADMSTLMADTGKNSQAFVDSLAQITQKAVELSREFNLDRVDVIKAFKEALSSGIDEKDLGAFGEASAQLARALGSDMGRATDILTSFKDSYGLTIDELVKVNDQLFNTIDVGKVNVQQLISSLGRVLPIAKSAGLGINDFLGALATMTRQGATTSQSVTALTNLITKTVNPSDKAQKKFQELGIAFGEAAFHGRGLVGFIEEIKQKTGGSLDILAEMYPEERAKRGVTLLEQGLDLYKQNIEAVDRNGSAQIAANKAMNTFGENIDKVAKTISGEFVLAGNELLDTANKVFFGGGPISPEQLQSIASEITTLKDGIVGIGTALINVASHAGSAWSALKDASGYTFLSSVLGKIVEISDRFFNGPTERGASTKEEIDAAAFAARAARGALGNEVRDKDFLKRAIAAEVPESASQEVKELSKLWELAESSAEEYEKRHDKILKHRDAVTKKQFSKFGNESEKNFLLSKDDEISDLSIEIDILRNKLIEDVQRNVKNAKFSDQGDAKKAGDEFLARYEKIYIAPMLERAR